MLLGAGAWRVVRMTKADDACKKRMKDPTQPRRAGPVAQEPREERLGENEFLEDLSERARLHRVADPETPRKPWAAELGSWADAGAGDKTV